MPCCLVQVPPGVRITMVDFKKLKGLLRRPEPTGNEKTATSEEAIFLLQVLQGRFIILLLGYFLSTIVGMTVLLEVGLYLFWIGSFVLTVSVFLVCETAFFFLMAWRTYVPFDNVCSWMGRQEEG